MKRLNWVVPGVVSSLLMITSGCANSYAPAPAPSPDIAQVTATNGAICTPGMSVPKTKGSRNLKVGARYRYADGLAVQITGSHRAKLDGKSQSGAGESVAVIDLRVTNGTRSTFDPSPLQIVASEGTGGNSARSIPDGPTAPIEGSIAAGKAKTGTYAFAIAKECMGDMIFGIIPGFSRAPVIFRGAIG